MKYKVDAHYLCKERPRGVVICTCTAKPRATAQWLGIVLPNGSLECNFMVAMYTDKCVVCTQINARATYQVYIKWMAALLICLNKLIQSPLNLYTYGGGYHTNTFLHYPKMICSQKKHTQSYTICKYITSGHMNGRFIFWQERYIAK